MAIPDDVLRSLSAAHEEALRVGDSPLRADRLADQVARIARAIAASDATEETRSRVGAALADAERVLRRDDDGREAARHLQTAISQAGPPQSRKPSPFLDD